MMMLLMLLLMLLLLLLLGQVNGVAHQTPGDENWHVEGHSIHVILPGSLRAQLRGDRDLH